jgi:predicted transcriptional regulator
MGTHSRPGRRETETSDYVAFMLRVADGYGKRIADDPAALVHAKDIQQALADAINRGVFEANAGRGHYSQNEMASMLGVSRQAIQQRIKTGRAVYAEIQRRLGAGALVRLGDVRARRAELLQQAGVEDSTGSVRELRARAS